MKSQVCRVANSLKNMTRSEAFRKAWATVKIDALESKLFDINMIDFWREEDRVAYDRIVIQISTLRENSKTNAEKEAERKAAEQAKLDKVDMEKRFFESMGYVKDDSRGVWVLREFQDESKSA